MLGHIMKSILVYFLPLAIPSTIALLVSERIRAKKGIVLWGNLFVFLFVFTYSLLTLLPEKPLQVELAFYALHEKPDNTYELRSLLGQGVPEFLGIEKELGEVKGVPIARSGEQSQMRLKLNRKGYAYVFHLDTTFAEVRQLFPSEEVQQSNPVPSDSWIGLPSSVSTWKFDQKPGLEVFLAYISSKESNDIKAEIVQIVEEAKRSSADRAAVLENLKQRFTALAPCSPTSSGEFVHNLTGVLPHKVKTYAYQAQDGQCALVCQFVLHKP